VRSDTGQLDRRRTTTVEPSDAGRADTTGVDRTFFRPFEGLSNDCSHFEVRHSLDNTIERPRPIGPCPQTVSTATQLAESAATAAAKGAGMTQLAARSVKVSANSAAEKVAKSRAASQLPPRSSSAPTVREADRPLVDPRSSSAPATPGVLAFNAPLRDDAPDEVQCVIVDAPQPPPNSSPESHETSVPARTHETLGTVGTRRSQLGAPQGSTRPLSCSRHVASGSPLQFSLVSAATRVVL